MDRRAYLVGLCAAFAGCTEQLRGGGIDRPRTRIYQPIEVETVAFDPDAEPVEGTQPVVTFDPAARQIRITGTAWAGNPCHGLVLDSLTYHDTTDGSRLSSLVVPARLKLDQTCPDSLGQESYELTVRFRSDSEFPTIVRAEQQDSSGETFTTIATR